MADNPAADFTLTLRRGEGMALLAMDWRPGKPPADFVGFAISYTPPGAKAKQVYNKLAFPDAAGKLDPKSRPTALAPIQLFRWVHFPPEAAVDGAFQYEVTPVHMAADGTLTHGVAQTESVVLGGDTFPDVLNIAFTRGYVSSQAFVNAFTPPDLVPALLPDQSSKGGPPADRLTFTPTHPKAAQAYTWMGFEARAAIEQVLDAAIADSAATVYVIAYDLDIPEIVDRLAQLGPRLHVIIDKSGEHRPADSPESTAAARLATTAGARQVMRDTMDGLQHNKTIVVDSPTAPTVVCGSTNYSWRGFYVQSNNALVLHGATAVARFRTAFEGYAAHLDQGKAFAAAALPPVWAPLGLQGVDAKVTFSPHSATTAVLADVAADMRTATSSVLYALAFLWESKGALRDAVKDMTEAGDVLVYGVSDNRVGGIDVQRPNADPAPVFPASLNADDTPAPFRVEPTGLIEGEKFGGARLHHKFVVIDFNTPAARVYAGSFNFSGAADTKNGENLVRIDDQRVATSYAIEALRIFDHYEFRLAQANAATTRTELELKRAPTQPGEEPWWEVFYSDPHKARDRAFFAKPSTQ